MEEEVKALTSELEKEEMIDVVFTSMSYRKFNGTSYEPSFERSKSMKVRRLPNANCSKCYGRGFRGWILPKDEPILCSCVIKK